jgi:hypothetical protein
MSESWEIFEDIHLNLKTPVQLFQIKYKDIMQKMLYDITNILEQKIDFTKSDIDSCIHIDVRWKKPKKEVETSFIIIPKELFHSFLKNPFFLQILLNTFCEKNWHWDHYIYDEYDNPLIKRRIYNKKWELIAKNIPLIFVPNIPD